MIPSYETMYVLKLNWILRGTMVIPRIGNTGISSPTDLFFKVWQERLEEGVGDQIYEGLPGAGRGCSWGPDTSIRIVTLSRGVVFEQFGHAADSSFIELVKSHEELAATDSIMYDAVMCPVAKTFFQQLFEGLTAHLATYSKLAFLVQRTKLYFAGSGSRPSGRTTSMASQRLSFLNALCVDLSVPLTGLVKKGPVPFGTGPRASESAKGFARMGKDQGRSPVLP
jgi:hypothetical protein